MAEPGGTPCGGGDDVAPCPILREAHYPKVLVRRLRRKLVDGPERPRYIHTEWGIGHRFASPR